MTSTLQDITKKKDGVGAISSLSGHLVSQSPLFTPLQQLTALISPPDRRKTRKSIIMIVIVQYYYSEQGTTQEHIVSSSVHHSHKTTNDIESLHDNVNNIMTYCSSNQSEPGVLR